ncbi:uncharacterized protein LOC124289185 [Haliotis rubra]|uniref:uncharacterized protein LOC124289185 n=1 Tax=Haliotis rubra TaxID=36100 RepID=UPI001EE59FAD|nr:uncharacterized protein LOC124289185 [Haliotis rubra]
MCIWFQLISATVTMAVSSTYHIQPFGFQMCQNLCYQIKGCSFLKFSSLHLDCDIPDKGQKKEIGLKCTTCFNKTKTLKEETFPVGECSQGERIITTKTKGRHCVRLKYTDDIPPDKRSSPRLLFGPTMNDRMYQLFLHNTSIVAYPYEHGVHVMSIIYLSTTQTLIVGHRGPDNIHSHTLNGSEHKIFLRNTAAKFMTVDEEAGSVFLGDRGDVKRVKTNGMQLRTIYKKKITVMSMAVYSKLKTLFVSVKSHCFSVSYGGNNFKVVKQGSNMYSIAVDTLNDLLYYNEGKHIIEMPLNNTSIQRRIQSSFTPWNILFHGENMYIGPGGGSNVFGVLKDRRDFVPITNVTKQKTSRCYICIIP